MGCPPEPVLAQAGTGMTYVFVEKYFPSLPVTSA